jgi:hypothetical protein
VETFLPHPVCTTCQYVRDAVGSLAIAVKSPAGSRSMEATLRYKFLVLEGPSAVGKSQFVRSMVRAVFSNAVVQGNMRSPNSEAFRSYTTTCCSSTRQVWSWCYRTSFCFQADNSWVQIARSSTTVHVVLNAPLWLERAI